jgi:RHS repeat-associated protein
MGQKPAPAQAGGEDGLSMAGRFGYTGQMRLPELGLYHYKARVYSPRYGRFLQPDPIGTNGGLNLYEYTLSDPINATDPWGLEPTIVTIGSIENEGDCIAYYSQPGDENNNPIGPKKLTKYSCAPKFSNRGKARGGWDMENFADAAVVVGFLIAPINPVIGGALILGGRVAGNISTGVQVGSAVIDYGRNGNTGGLINAAGTLAGSVIGGRQGGKLGSRLFGSQQIRNALGQFGEKRAVGIAQAGQNIGGSIGGSLACRR